jgi:copper homeostasis protein CutC
MGKRIADNLITLSTPLSVTFFKAWLDFTVPLHGLTNKEKDVMAHYLKKHHELSKVIMNDAILAQVLSDTSTKQEIMSACGLKASNLQVILHKFKKIKVLVDGVIDPKLIPALTQDVEDSGEFRLMVRFLLKDEN